MTTSRYASVQVDSVATLVNLSLEDRNKVKIVRSGIVPSLIDVLMGGFPESQEHTVGALFSLALDDQNKTTIGVLGALPPLLLSTQNGRGMIQLWHCIIFRWFRITALSWLNLARFSHY